MADLGGHLGSSHPFSHCPPPGAAWKVAGSRECCALHHTAKCCIQNITSPGHFSGSGTWLTEPTALRLLLACHRRRLGALRAVSWAGPSGFRPAQGFWGRSSPFTTLLSALSRCFNWRPGRRLPGLSLPPGPPPGPSLRLKPCSREEDCCPSPWEVLLQVQITGGSQHPDKWADSEGVSGLSRLKITWSQLIRDKLKKDNWRNMNVGDTILLNYC